MAAIGSRAWKTILIIAAILFVGGMLLSGFLIPGIAFLVLLIVGGAIAMLTKKSNVPDR